MTLCELVSVFGYSESVQQLETEGLPEERQAGSCFDLSTSWKE
jgi:hypothetical protein